jgi:predicted TIM-barrel fold metal-dependent hydrolase
MLPADARLISLSDHHIEPPDLYSTGLPASMAARAPRLIDIADGQAQAWRYGDQLMPLSGVEISGPLDEIITRPVRYEEAPESTRSARARLEAMDADGVDVHCLFPSSSHGCAGEQLRFLGDLDVWAACVATYNDYVVDAYAAVAPDRLVPVAILPFGDPVAATAEVHRAAGRGVRAVTLPCNPGLLGLPSWHDAANWDPVLTAIEEHGMPLLLHIGTIGESTAPGRAPDAPLVSYLTLANLDVLGAVVELAYSPVLHHHPELEIVVVEGGAGWLPYLTERIDFFWRYEHARGAGTVRDVPPSQLLGRVKAAFIDDASAIRQRDEIGIDRMLWISDFPHPDGFWPHSRRALAAALRDVDDDDAIAIAGGNAAALLRL